MYRVSWMALVAAYICVRATNSHVPQKVMQRRPRRERVSHRRLDDLVEVAGEAGGAARHESLAGAKI